MATKTTKPPTYRAEILTADKAGLLAFVTAVKQARNGRLSRGAMTRSSSLGAYPMSSNGGVDAYRAVMIGALNRDVVPSRVREYHGAMLRGDWWFTPDPIVVTDEGDIINGQHRLLAALEALPEKDDTDPRPAPQFVVVWGVDKRAAILMDESRRSTTDRRDIAMRFARASSNGSK